MLAGKSHLDLFRRTVLDAPVSYSVFSAFSFYGSRRGNELAGTWLVAALTAMGHELPAVRQTLYRMEGSAVLQSRVVGRNKFYRLSPGARADAEAGLAKMMSPPPGLWDKQWTIVQLIADGEDRSGKELVREVVRAEGFGRVGPNLFIHPRDRTARLIAAARGHGVTDLLTIFRGRRQLPEDDRVLVSTCWDLRQIASGYRTFVKRFAPIAKGASAISDLQAFLLRFALVFDFLEIGWSDPELPLELLPPDWPGLEAKQLVQQLYRRLLPGALAFGDRLNTRSR
jgi:phenylacetic acid degradation operon negative regulatory protein